MSEGHSEGSPEVGAAPVPEPEESPPPPAVPTRPQRPFRRAALWLASVLGLVVAGVALSPFWALDLAPLLPWGNKSTTSTEAYGALDARLAAIEKRPAASGADLDAVKSAESALARRVDQLDATFVQKLAEIDRRSGSSGSDLDAIKAAESALARRVDQLEAATSPDHPSDAIAATRSGLEQLGQRLAAVESQLAELQKVQPELAHLGSVTADLATRLSALERQAQSQNNAERTDPALALLLLRMREAVEQARPFPAEYSAFKALCRDPSLIAAVEPLAGAARNGVASRAVLSKRLAELAGQITTPTESPTESDWGAQALARLRGLVTIRRIDGASQTGPEAAVSAAETALSRDDLPSAVSALDMLSGANAEAARPWLRMARDRLAVETALDQLQELLTARLGNTSGPPAGGQEAPSTKTRAPS